MAATLVVAVSATVCLAGTSRGAWHRPRVPVGKYVEDNEGAWQLNTSASAFQDIDYINHIIEDVAERHVIDPDRLYAVGYSGSMFACELACHLSHRFAAIASFAGSMPIRPTACDPKRHVPLMLFMA